ncbi:hypothetical protein [Paraflavitalea pollutisoli]|uniref:hypothetical protein n=1 Tax=Paraflavitalea pollutisoli TaxID=3034143 RepID=UPI0023EC2619|nr:hypothetical protein [Paraflavitalea sp. H1-2-19X]
MTIQQSNSEILNLLSEGKTYKEITAQLKIPYRTICHRISQLKKVHNCVSLAQLLVKLCTKSPSASSIGPGEKPAALQPRADDGPTGQVNYSGLLG